MLLYIYSPRVAESLDSAKCDSLGRICWTPNCTQKQAFMENWTIKGQTSDQWKQWHWIEFSLQEAIANFDQVRSETNSGVILCSFYDVVKGLDLKVIWAGILLTQFCRRCIAFMQNSTLLVLIDYYTIWLVFKIIELMAAIAFQYWFSALAQTAIFASNKKCRQP